MAMRANFFKKRQRMTNALIQALDLEVRARSVFARYRARMI
jgi:hypothetical protein